MQIEEKVNAAKITVADLLKVTEEVHKLPEEDRDWEGRAHLMIRLFKGNPTKAQAIEYRLIAMSRVIASGKLPGWALPQGSDGATSVAEAVWKAAAIEPLVFVGEYDEPKFDEAAFLARILSMAEPEGNA